MGKKVINNHVAITTLIIFGLLFQYISQMHPAAVLPSIMDEMLISMAEGGFSISVIFFPIIIVSLIGPYILQKIGLKKMYSAALLVGGAGVAMYLIADNYTMLILSRILYGVGFGLGTPFIGAAIMHWYNPKQQVTMNTVNALFPYIGNVIVYGLTVPLIELFSGSWRMALAIWGIFAFVVLLFWMIMVKDEGPVSSEIAGEVSTDKNVYMNLIKRKEINILIIAFVCDFISFSIVASMLPTYYILEAGFSPELANNLTMIFPLAGIVGGLIAFWYMDKSGRRKGLLVLGQFLKALGIVLFFFGKTSLVGYAGIALVGMGNCIWIPPMFIIPMELDKMNPTLVGAAFSLILSCGFVSGLIAPAVAGWMGDNFSLRMAIFLCTIPCLIGMFACMKMPETGPGKVLKNIA
jgi:MFS family permease